MNPPNLPAVRLQLVGDGDCTVHDAVDVTPRQNHHSRSSDNMSPDVDSANQLDSDLKDHPMYWQHHLQALYPAVLPHFSRSLTMPTTSSQLGLLHNPLRKLDVSSSRSAPVSPGAYSCHEVSLELADSLQSIIQTMLQVSPQQVLDPAREQFAPCTFSVPMPCMSSMLSILKNLNYISANMSTLCAPSADPKAPGPDLKISHTENVDFDIGELLQSIGDGMSGVASKAGVDLVLYHGDVGLKHIWVRGDVDAINFALTHAIRQDLSTAQPGDTIELGLLTAPVSQEKHLVNGATSHTEAEERIHLTFVISHKFFSVDPAEEQTRPKPTFSTLLLRRILHQIDAKLVSDLPPPPCFKSGRTFELRLTLARRKSTPAMATKSEGEVDLVAAEPSLEQLSTFAESLKGKRVALYSSSKGSFAQHFTSYLTAWGMDVDHFSPEGNVEDVTAATDVSNPSEPQEAAETTMDDTSDQAPPPTCFIVIDDDVNILKERLYALRNGHQPCIKPSLANAHRPPSSTSTVRPGPLPAITSSAVVLHFTNLSNYKAAKDALQTVIASYSKLHIPAPDVMIIPKPAGPRRLLTALHTAVTKPIIDPLFLPIATSPQSPGIFAHGTFFSNYASANAPTSHRLPSKAAIPRPYGGRANTDRSTRSSANSDHSPLHPPSPLGAPDSVEYFSRAAYRLGGSPSSGLVIQSPDGQPAGIFFHPRIKGSSRTPSAHSMERDRGHPERRGQSVGRGTTTLNDRGAASRTPQPQPAPPVRASSTTGVPQPKTSKPIVRSHSGPGPEQASTSTSSSSSNEVQAPAPVAPANTDPVQVIVQTVSPPDSATPKTTATPARRSMPRRRTADSDSSAGASAIAPSGKSDGKKKAAENPIVPPISVLIVDDNPINQTILSTFMKKKKIQFDIANNGLEAVEKWKTGAFHLILMDIQMPVMDGINATKEIRRLEKTTAQALYPTTPTPSTESGYSPGQTPPELLSSESRPLLSPYHPSVIIVALTASSLQSDRVAALGAGCNDFLTKPVSLLWLNSKIIEWGSIKALQMWADLRPSVMRSISHGQQVQARNIAERLHVPKARMNGLSPQAQASETTMTTSKPTGTSLGIQNDQTQNVTRRAQDETKSGDIISTSTSNESRASSNKAVPVQGNAAVASVVDGGDSDTRKVPSQTSSSFPAMNKVSKSEMTPCRSPETVPGIVFKSPVTLRQNSGSPNGRAVDETTNCPRDVSSARVS